MKKISIYAIAIILLVSYTAKAQKGFHVGFNASAINTYLVDSKLYGDVDYRPKFTVGSLFGASAGNNFTDQFGVEMEVNYARLGQMYEYDDSIDISPYVTTQQGKVTLDYYQIPVMLKFTGGDFKTRFSASLGPQFSFLANGKSRKTEGGEIANTKEDFNKTDIGLLLNAGTDVRVTEDLYFNVGLRMYYGFNQANKTTRVMAPSPFPGSKQTEDHLLNAYGGINVGLHYLIRNNKAMTE